jgi:hypothetical protein
MCRLKFKGLKFELYESSVVSMKQMAAVGPLPTLVTSSKLVNMQREQKLNTALERTILSA